MVRTSLFLTSCLFLDPLSAQVFRLQSVPAFPALPGDGRSVNWIDVDGDGREDLFISNGPKGGQNNALYLNRGGEAWQTVTGDPIVQDGAPSDGATFADVDGDGDPDAFVVTWYGAPNNFYRNEGGRFRPDTLCAAAAADRTFSETAAWGDYDGDGRPDLYITNSTDFRTNAPSLQRNLLYRQEAGGAFTRVDTGALVEDARISRAAIWTDYDGDGDADLFVANEENQANSLYRNEGGGYFRPVANALTADTLSSTGAGWADVDNDGDLDCFVANFLRQNNQLFLNDGNGEFTPVAGGDPVSDGGCSFGSAFADYDNDGDLDLFVANGFCSGQRNFFYVNNGAGRFRRDTSAFPAAIAAADSCSFGAAWGDPNDDGFPDLAVTRCRNRTSEPLPSPALYYNTPNGNHWLKVRLTGARANRSALGAKVRVRASIDGRTIIQLREISSQTGYCGQNSLYAHFGLGNARRVEEIRVEWPSGQVSLMRKVRVDRVVTMEEE